MVRARMYVIALSWAQGCSFGSSGLANLNQMESVFRASMTSFFSGLSLLTAMEKGT